MSAKLKPASSRIQKFLLELGVARIPRKAVPAGRLVSTTGSICSYHIKLRCFVIIDLKTGRSAGYAGKMNFYWRSR